MKKFLSNALPIGLGLFFLAAGLHKFSGGGVVFRYMEFQTSWDWMYPYGQMATGVIEVAAGVLMIVKRTRLAGAALAAATLLGALAAHLSPWLGIAIPSSVDSDITSSFVEDDFATTTQSATFTLAVVTTILSFTLIRLEYGSRTAANAEGAADIDVPTPV